MGDPRKGETIGAWLQRERDEERDRLAHAERLLRLWMDGDNGIEFEALHAETRAFLAGEAAPAQEQGGLIHENAHKEIGHRIASHPIMKAAQEQEKTILLASAICLPALKARLTKMAVDPNGHAARGELWLRLHWVLEELGEQEKTEGRT